MALTFKCVEVTVSSGNWARFKFDSVYEPIEWGVDCPKSTIMLYFTNEDHFDDFELNGFYEMTLIAQSTFFAMSPEEAESLALKQTEAPAPPDEVVTAPEGLPVPRGQTDPEIEDEPR